MAQPEPLSVDDALDRLVNQFADPMAFFRELVQNAVDAGSDEVEIRMVWDRGVMVVHVDDWGSGMTREIIESKLTRLFSSSKDNDQTKIGKFGIGFVSVFAIDPDAVCIDTSREGEHWRILFDEQRRFSLIRRAEPVEGTKIQIFKSNTRAEFEQFRARAREVVTHWCKHLRGEIRVEGEVINQPFDLDLPCKVLHERDEEQIVVGHPLDGQGFAGFYNRGLTLLELRAGSTGEAGQVVEGEAGSVVPGIAFKVSSGKLEHTLTRDDVIRERSFDRVMERVRELAGEPLANAVAERLAAVIRELDLGAVTPEQLEQLEYLWRALHQHALAGTLRANQLIQPTFRTVAGGLVRPTDLIGLRNAAVVVGHAPSPTAERLNAGGTTVIWLPATSVHGPKLLAWMTRACTPIDRWCTATPARDAEERQRWQPLIVGLTALLQAWGAKLASVELGYLDAADPNVRGRVAITQREFGEATPIGECGELDTRLLASKRVVVLNAEHPTLRSIAALAQREPELAAYLAAKAFLLGGKLDAATDEALAGATHALREQRRSQEP